MSAARHLRRGALLGLALLASRVALAEPWIVPGDASLRSDLQLLADAGVVHGPVTTWPISWPDVSRDVLAVNVADVDARLTGALLRVQRRARDAQHTGFDGAGLRAGGASEPIEMRGFADSPREQGELSLRATWLGDHLALNAQGTVVADPADGKRFRPDGSYLGVNIGNFMVSAGFMERWWGPGWEGSLILSTNARPIPSITLERNYTDPFETKLLSWIGPWRASIALGEAESSGVAVPKVRFMAARVNFRPRPWMEVGLTRTAQWCGGERDCGFGTFVDMLVGRDNQTGDGVDDQPGNQMAGYDVRIRSPWKRLPVAFYSQWIGEDEAGGLPSKFLGLFGLEAWTHLSLGDLRVHAEYADTACNFSREAPELDCAYRNDIYPQGYAFRGRPIGHSIDADSRLYSLAAQLVLARGDTLSLTLRRAELNRDGNMHALSDVPTDLDNVELRYSRALGAGRITVGAAYDNRSPSTESRDQARGFLTWQQGF